MENFKNVTTYGLVSGIYFNKILMTIIKLGDLENEKGKIMDFGCGYGNLKKILNNNRVINYDIISELSDVPDWRSCDFNVMVANQVFYSFHPEQLKEHIDELFSINPNVRLIVGISKQGLLNNIGKILLGRWNAHRATKMKPFEEKEILLSKMKVENKKTVFFLMDIYLLKFSEL